MASLCQHGAALAHRSRQGPTHSGPHSLPVALPSLFTRPGGLWIEARSTSQTPPQPSVCFAQLCKFQFPLPRISLTPPLPNPLVPLPTIICLPPHTSGVPHQVQKSVTPESQQVFLHMASVPLMKPDYDSSGSLMKWSIFKARIIFFLSY